MKHLDHNLFLVNQRRAASLCVIYFDSWYGRYVSPCQLHVAIDLYILFYFIYSSDLFKDFLRLFIFPATFGVESDGEQEIPDSSSAQAAAGTLFSFVLYIVQWYLWINKT